MWNMANVNKLIQLGITSGNQCLFFQLCLYLYLSIEGNNYLIKTGCICIVIMDSLLLYFYCNDGQKIIDEYDEVRRCLGECSWVDKPQWFKKMLLTMMIRSSAPFHMKPFGLYVINSENFINVMKASYSYFNLIRTLK
ncbi:odorant receptor 56a-like [Lycorma delicatula]|uniref:odorant receptor 56a-like n=1 Tax=Lycorma delicatula TaxID=130591 RepID=UPI003F50EB4F